MRRIALLLIVTSSVLIAAGCGQYGKRYEGESNTRAANEERKITDVKFDDAARKRDGCTELKEYESEGRQHTNYITEKVEYKQNPPVSGNHYEIAAEWGLYDKVQPDVQTVHNMEHGHIIISHDGLTQQQQDKLIKQVKINPFHLLLQPRPKNPKKGVYYSAWTAQIYCKQPSAPALQYMIEEWRDQGPELFTDDASGGSMGV